MKFRHSDGESRMIADATTITDSPAANSGSSMMKARRSTHGIWRSMAIIIVFAAVMLAASIAPALADTAITNCMELQNIHSNLGGDYYLANDIDCSGFDYDSDGKGFMPIGTSSSPFTGTFDGNGYKITNLYINRSSTDHVGLFGYIDSGREITNVSLEEVDVSGSRYVGGLVGVFDSMMGGEITNCYSTGNVNGSSEVGGLVGYSVAGTITNCYSTGSVTGSSKVGGLVGYSPDGTITNCYSTGSVTGPSEVGGLVGLFYCDMGVGTITNCYSTGSVTGYTQVGGLVGDSTAGTITNCYSTGNVTGSSKVGGLVGYSVAGTITNCYSTGSVGGSDNVGGLVGYYRIGTIINCYSTGSVGGSDNVGGLVGCNLGIITNCYSTGSVNGSSDVGGLVGYNRKIITNSYWDTETSGRSSSDGGTGKTTAQMKQQATFSSWDFTNIWAIEEGVTYPYLQWQHAAAEPPTITSFAPSTPVSNIAEATQTFNITIDQTVNVTWYINGTNVLDANTNVTAASYTNASAEIGVWNVSAVAENANGTDMQMWVWNVRENTPPTITIDAPTQFVPVLLTGGGQFQVNFTYTELNPANYTVTIRNETAIINSTTNTSVSGGTGMTANESFNLNASAANGWYNATVEMYDNSPNYNITHQNNSVEKGSYDASISQPENQATESGVNATYELNITNTGNFAGTFTLALTNHDTADIAALNKTTITDLAIGASQNVTLNVTDASAGTYNVTVNVTSTDSGSEVASTGYIMTMVVGPTLTLGNVDNVASDWGTSFDLNHSVTVTNAAASNVNVTYNVSWVLNNSTMGTIAQGGMRWHNQTRSNPTVQNITLRVDANTTTASAMNDSKTFLVNITRRNIDIASQPGSTQSVGTDTTFWINASANDEHRDTLICKADLIREGVIIGNQTISNGNVNFSRIESNAGSFNFSIRFYNTTHYDNASTSNKTVTVRGPTLTLGNVDNVASDWGTSLDLNHSVAVTNATASNVNVTYNVSWILNNTTMGTISQDGMKWHNQTRSNQTVQNITVRVDATSTTGSAINDSETFSINITRRDINVTAGPGSEQTMGVGDTFWINGSAKDEHNEAFIAKADLLKDGSIVNTTDVMNGNANFSTDESAAGTFNFSIRFYNTSHYDNASTSNKTVTVRGPILALGNINDITRDWGRSFNLNHLVTVTNAAASNVNVTYNVSWILNNNTMGTISQDGMKWHNQTRSNPTVQNITARVNANTTTASAMNDSKTFSINITRRETMITADPIAPQSVNPNTTFWINGSADGEYAETFIGKADLVRNGNIIDNKTTTDGKANFSRTEPAEGTFNFSIRFYNTTHYNNKTTNNATMHIVDDTPPASITGLDNLATEQSRIHWTWTDPADIDFAKVMIYLNGTFKTNVSKDVRNYTATGLDPDTNYTIGTHTIDDKGNINQAWVNDTARTLPFADLQRINVTPDSWTLNISESMEFNATGYDHNNDTIDPSNLTFAWDTTPAGIGTLNATTGSVVNFTALHAGRTGIYAINGSVSSNKVWITVNALDKTEDVTNGTGNATSGNSTAIVNLNNESVNGTITIEEIGDPLNKTVDIGNRTGLGTDSEPIKGVNVTVNGSIVAALNDTGGYVHIRVEYNESQLGNIDEDTTGWVKLEQGNPTYCIANGRNTAEDYIWVNVTNCSTFMLAGTPTAAPTPTPTPPGSSNGGGGIGVSSGNEPGNVEESVVRRIYLGAGSSSAYNFNNVVTSVEVTPDRTYGQVAARIEVLYGQPGSITTALPAGELYKYVNVFVGTTGWAEGKFSSSVINFQVPESWFEENNIDPESVVMYRHNNGKWQSLETTMTGQAGGFYRYSSPTSGFSTFLILGQVGDSGTGETADASDSGTETDPTHTPEATSTKGTPGFGILVGIMGILIAVYSRKK